MDGHLSPCRDLGLTGKICDCPFGWTSQQIFPTIPSYYWPSHELSWVTWSTKTSGLQLGGDSYAVDCTLLRKIAIVSESLGLFENIREDAMGPLSLFCCSVIALSSDLKCIPILPVLFFFLWWGMGGSIKQFLKCMASIYWPRLHWCPLDKSHKFSMLVLQAYFPWGRGKYQGLKLFL